MGKYMYEAKRFPFFEGWYFKHQSSQHSLCIIVGRNRDKSGAGTSFIQIITENQSYNISFRLENFIYLKNRFAIKIEGNYFTEKGIVLDIDTDAVKIRGKIEYAKLTPLKSDIMGPFSKIPYLECKHFIISMYHTLHGIVSINGESISFDNGTGYIEGDCGKSFPEDYKWFQCNDFGGRRISAVVALADMSLFRKKFRGCFAVVTVRNREYKLATYKGAVIECENDGKIVLKQGKLRLTLIYSDTGKSFGLLAPNEGNMSRVIREGNDCNAIFRLYYDDFMVFSAQSRRCSCEISEKET